MNIKRNISKLVSGLLCFSMIFGNVLPAYAADAVITENTLDGEDLSIDEKNLEDITVTYKQASSFFVTIPKTIVLDGWKQSTYAVKVSGDIDADQCVYVAPVDGIADTENIDFYMKDQASENAKDDVVANVTHNKFHWSSAEVAESHRQDDNLVSAPDLTAGAWKGIFQMEIKLETHVTHKHNYVAAITKEPTCTEKGEKIYTCDCGDSYTEVVPAKGHHFEDGECTDCGEKDPDYHKHSYTEKITKQPTCTEKGEKTYTCSCGDSYTDEIPATGHHYGDDDKCTGCGELNPNHKHNYTEKITKEPTCTEAGEKTFTCDCGDSYTEVIPATGHSYVDGECEHCHEKDPDYHEHSYDNGVVTKEPTCTEKGEKTFTCSECGHTYTEEIPATGHNFENHICTNCGETDPNHVHNYEPYQLTIEPQLVSSTKGVYPTNEYKYTKWTTSTPIEGYSNFYVKSICTGGNTGSQFNATAEIVLPDDYEGEYNYKYYFKYTMGCSDKGAAVRLLLNGSLIHRYSVGQVVSAIGSQNTIGTIPLHAGKNTVALQAHFYNASGSANPDANRYNWYNVYLENITLFDGTEYHICNECGKKEKHVLGETVTKLATCTEAGEKVYTCSICEGQFTEEIPATGHNYVEGVCDKCGDLNLKLTTTPLFSASTSTSTTTDSGHGHYDQAILNGTYSDEIEITEDMGENDYLQLYFTVTRPKIVAAADPVSGSSMLQKYDEGTNTWKTIYSYGMTYSNLTDFSMRNAEGGGGNGRTEWISRNFQLEKGKYRVYGQFTGKASCGSSVAHDYWFYNIRASLCRMEIDTETP